MLKGANHVHSCWSDGEFTLAELREIFATGGCRFSFVTDHAESMGPDQIQAYVRECASLSDDRFQFIPGLEFECKERMHILGFGVTLRINSQDPEEVIRHIEREGGVSVIAHPPDRMFEAIGGFQVLPNGIEVWNTKYDGRYAPRPATFDFLRTLQERKPDIHAFYGQDLHWKRQFRGLFVQIQCDVLSRELLLAALARGDFSGQAGDLVLPSSGKLPDALLNHFATVYGRSDRMRRAIKGIKKMTDRVGLKIPPGLKGHLRRIF
jgi:hypothetical protein